MPLRIQGSGASASYFRHARFYILYQTLANEGDEEGADLPVFARTTP